MLVSGTLYVIFAATLLIANQVYKELFTGENNLLMMTFAFLSFLLGLFFYYKGNLFSEKQN